MPQNTVVAAMVRSFERARDAHQKLAALGTWDGLEPISQWIGASPECKVWRSLNPSSTLPQFSIREQWFAPVPGEQIGVFRSPTTDDIFAKVRAAEIPLREGVVGVRVNTLVPQAFTAIIAANRAVLAYVETVVAYRDPLLTKAVLPLALVAITEIPRSWRDVAESGVPIFSITAQ